MANIFGYLGNYGIQIVNLDKIPDSEERMRALFQDMLEKVLDTAEENEGVRPQSFSMKIDSDNYDYTGFFSCLLVFLMAVC